MDIEIYLKQIEPDIKKKSRRQKNKSIMDELGMDWEDIAQELRIRLWKNLKQFDEKKSSFRTWANRVMENYLANLTHKRQDQLGNYIPIDEIDTQIEGENDIEKIENKIDIDLALNRLPQRQREVAKLLLEGYKLEEIAEELGIAEGTVKRYFYIIKKKQYNLFGTNSVYSQQGE